MLSLLYVDDEPGLLELGKLFLESTGEFMVTTALSGDFGLEQLAQHDFDAVISDYQMPGMDGIELLKNVRQSFGTIPFILFTGRGREEVVIAAINNGVDFYLQKGGDPKAQFAELAHKVRQAVTRRRAETALSDSEKRLADIINFLPDATFAIDTGGKVIAWNRAIEEMTGVAAADMLGKGEYEYAVPFYGTRRRILIDLVFEPEKEIQEQYTGITREKDVLIAETDLPRPRGMQRTLMGKASPLYNRKGKVIGAIESIRDITQKKETEAALQEQNRVLASMNKLSLELAAIPSHENIREFAIKKLVEMTGAVAAWFCDYDPAGRFLAINHLEVTPPLLKEATRLLGKLPEDVRTTVSEDLYSKIINSRVLKFSTLTEVSFGQVSPAVSRSIQALAGIDRFYGLAYVIGEDLYGTSVLALKKGQSDPSKELLESFAHIMAVSLSRRGSEERLAASEEKFRTVADFTFGWEYWEAPDRGIVYMSPSCERISGYSAEDFYRIPRLLDSIIDPRDREAWENHRNEADTTKTALTIDFCIVRKDGGIRWINHICHPVFDSVGRHQGLRASIRDITDKKQTDDELRAAYEQITASQEELQGQFDELAESEQRIRESETKFRELAELLPQMVFEVDLGFRVTYANQIALTTMGVADKDLEAGVSALSFIDPSDHERIRQNIEKLFRGETVANHEYTAVRGDGSTFPVMIYAAPISRSGKPAGIRGIVVDITDRKKTENALRESEIFLKETQGIARLGGWKTNPHTDYLEWTDGIYDIIEAPRDYRPGLTEGMKYYAPEDIPVIREKVASCLETGEPFSLEVKIITETGKTVWTELRGLAPVIEGARSYVIGTLQDITERKLNEDTLRESRDRFKVTIASLDDAVFLVDPATRQISECNAAATRIFGYSDGEMVGRETNFLHVDQAHVEQFGREAKATYEDPGFFKREFEMRRKDGCVFPTEHFVRPIHDPDGRILYVVSVVRDITERKRAKEALRESEERFKTLFEKSAEAQLLLDGTGKVADCNAAFLTLFALKDKGEIRGHSPEDFAPEFQPDGTRSSERGDEIFALLMREGMARYEWAHLKHDPARTPILNEVICTLIQIAEQPMVHVSIRDITDRKKAEEALQESEQNYRGVIENLQDVFYRADAAGNITMASPSATDMFGYSSVDEVMGLNLARDIYTDPENRRDFLTAIQKTGSVKNFEAVLKKKDGSPVIVSTSAHYYLDPDGNVLGVEGIAKDITVWKHAEEALRESETKFRAVIDQSFQFIGLMNTDGILIEANRSALAFAGISESDVINQPFWETPWWSHSKELQKKLKDAIQRAASGETVRFEATHPAADGHLAYVDFSVKPVVDPTGKILYLIPEGRDITERKRAEEVLRAANEQLSATEEELRQQYEELGQNEERLRVSEEKFRTLVETTSDFIWEVDESGTYTYVSPQVRELLGYEPEELIGKTPFDFMQPDEARRVTAEFTRLVGSRLPISSLENSCIHKNGSNVVLETSGVPRLAKDGSFAGYRGIDRDITTRKHAEEALRESEAKYRILADTSPEMIYLIDPEGRIQYVNTSSARAFRTTPEDLVGKQISDLFPPDIALNHLEGIRKVISTRQPVIHEIAEVLPSGTIWIDVRLSPVIDHDNRVIGVLGLSNDITQRKTAEEALKESEAKFRELTELLPQIVFEMDRNFMITFVNRQAYTALGYTPEDIAAGLNALSTIDPSQHDRIRENVRKLVKKEPYEHREYTFIRKDGSAFPAFIYADPIVHSGELTGFRGIIIDISDRKHAEEALRESEEKYRTLVEINRDIIYSLSIDGTILYVSPQTMTLLGYRPDEMEGRNFAEFVHPDEIEELVRHIHEHFDAGEPVRSDRFRVRRKDGTYCWFEDKTMYATDRRGNNIIAGTIRDITEEKAGQDALRESEARLSSILHGSPVLQFVIDSKHQVISWNNALEEYSGVKAADIIGTDQQWRAFYSTKRPVLADLLVDGNTDAITRLYAGKLRKSRYVEEAYEATDFFPRMGSSGIWLSFTAAPIRDETGAITGAIETLEDVTERVNAEKVLRESDEWTRTILNTAQAGIVLVDANSHRIIDANRKALELIGLPQDAVTGAVCHRFICPTDVGKCPVTDCAQDVNTSERVLLTASGTQIPVLKTVVRVSMGGRDLLVESFVDISEQKRSEAAIRETNRKLNLLNSITRHDIRNQLMVAHGYTQLAALNKPDPVITDFLVKITAAIETIQRQIEFTKAYQELGVHAPAWFLVDEVIRSGRPGKIALHNTCNAVEIYADPMIDNVFFNLFDNAVKYGERVTTITVGCEKREKGLVITFADNGSGIAADEKQKIFEKGYGQNTGFGLFLVREILAITGITINETGTYGKGAVFEITVPEGAYRKAT